jgi:hypothetical protein
MAKLGVAEGGGSATTNGKKKKKNKIEGMVEPPQLAIRVIGFAYNWFLINIKNLANCDKNCFAKNTINFFENHNLDPDENLIPINQKL